MYQTLLNDASLYRLLFELDGELAAKAREAGCCCGGRLDSARYVRKARGVPTELNEAFSSRHSFCCAKEGCRRRTTPASFRFLGRRVFTGAVVVLVTALRHGATPARANKLRELVGVSRRTLERWRQWWQKEFVRAPFWKAAQRRLLVQVDKRTLPLSLLDVFGAQTERDRLVDLLRLLLPLTTSSAMPEP